MAGADNSWKGTMQVPNPFEINEWAERLENANINVDDETGKAPAKITLKNRTYSGPNYVNLSPGVCFSLHNANRQLVFGKVAEFVTDKKHVTGILYYKRKGHHINSFEEVPRLIRLQWTNADGSKINDPDNEDNWKNIPDSYPCSELPGPQLAGQRTLRSKKRNTFRSKKRRKSRRNKKRSF